MENIIEEKQRNKKRTVIILIMIGAIIFLGFVFYLIFRSNPTCTDGKQNQGEKGIDCGGPCKACIVTPDLTSLEIKEKAFVYSSQGKYDAVAKVSNPNNGYGSSKFSYEFKLMDEGGNILATKIGEDFILPSETKYIIETSLESKTDPKQIEFKILNGAWDEFSGYEEPELNIYNKRYNLISNGVGYSEAFGLLRNESPFDFDAIKINIVLRDGLSKIVALNKTEMRTVNSREERDFRLVWPNSFQGDVQGVEVEASADVFDSQNFIKKYLPARQFQSY